MPWNEHGERRRKSERGERGRKLNKEKSSLKNSFGVSGDGIWVFFSFPKLRHDGGWACVLYKEQGTSSGREIPVHRFRFHRYKRERGERQAGKMGSK